MRVHTRTHAHTRTHTHACMHTHMHANTHVHTRTHTHTHTHRYTDAHPLHANTHTHTHTDAHSLQTDRHTHTCTHTLPPLSFVIHDCPFFLCCCAVDRTHFPSPRWTSMSQSWRMTAVVSITCHQPFFCLVPVSVANTHTH